MSAQQQRLWVLHQLEHARTGFNVPVCVRLKGRLERSLLEKSIELVLNRHRLLGSCFIAMDGHLMLAPAPPSSEVFSFTDLSSLFEFDREDRLQRLMSLELSKPFDLAAAPPIRIRLLRVSRHDHVLLLIAHQIACDTISANLLLEEIAEQYGAGVQEGPRSGAEPVMQYSDYVCAQNQYLRKDSQSDLAFWRQQLEGIASGIELPVDFPRPPEPSFCGEQESVSLAAPLVSALRSVSSREKIPVRMVLLSGFVALLCRYAGLDEIVLGTEVPGRTMEGTSHLVGPLANHLVLRVDASGNPPFAELVHRVNTVYTAAEAHQAFPFAKLLENTRLERDLSRNPLFQVKFAVDADPPVPVFAGMNATRLVLKTGAEMLDLTLRMCERSDGLELTFSYSTDLFSATTIDRMRGHFEELLRGAAEQPGRGIFELPILGADERRQLLVDWNETSLECPHACVHQLFERQTRATPDRVAISFADKNLTYSQLNARSNQLARHLRKRGASPDSVVGIYIERSLDMVVALLGVLKAGAAYVPLDPSYPPDRIAFILEDAQIRLVLTQEMLCSWLPSSNAELICLDADWSQIMTEEQADPGFAVAAENLAYTLYTSGSTGKPKGVQIEHRNVVNFLTTMRREPGLSAEDVLLAVTTLSFDIAGLEIYLPLTVGAKVVIASREQAWEAHALERLMSVSRVTAMQATPATWRLLIEGGWSGDRSLKVLCGGEALPRELAEQLLPRCGELWNMYGPTETTIWSSIHRLTDVNWSLAPIGRPIGNTRMYVVDKHRQLLPVGVAGELCIGGDGLARGYWNRPELTAEKFVPDPFLNRPGARIYRTGDLVRYLRDGNIQYLGRMDNQVKIRGFRIELGEIESVLTQHSAVRQAVVAVREDRPGDKQIVAYLNPDEEQALDLAEIRSLAKEKLPEYMLPSRWVTVTQFPLTPNGKVDRKALPVPVREASPPGREAPRDELEANLISIFETVLGVRPVGVTDDFFELGGHSVMAARLMTEIRNLTGRQLSLSSLFQGANVRGLRNVLDEETAGDAESTVTQIQAGTGSTPPFFAVVSPGESGIGYAILARHLGPDRPFYQLQANEPIAIDRPYTWEELRNLADQYVAAMRATQPRGPYFFGGMCDGAHLAIRMAHKLEQLGESVGMLAIFDTWVLENSQRRLLWKVSYYTQRLQQFRQLSLGERLQIVTKTSARLLKKLRGQRERSAWSQAYWPAEDYIPPSFNGRITLFKDPKQPYYYKRDPLMGWGDRARGGVDAHVLPIGHSSILREPTVQVLAKHLVECLENACFVDAHPKPDEELVEVSLANSRAGHPE